jgi:hypothetical protein
MCIRNIKFGHEIIMRSLVALNRDASTINMQGGRFTNPLTWLPCILSQLFKLEIVHVMFLLYIKSMQSA